MRQPLIVVWIFCCFRWLFLRLPLTVVCMFCCFRWFLRRPLTRVCMKPQSTWSRPAASVTLWEKSVGSTDMAVSLRVFSSPVQTYANTATVARGNPARRTPVRRESVGNHGNAIKKNLTGETRETRQSRGSGGA